MSGLDLTLGRSRQRFGGLRFAGLTRQLEKGDKVLIGNSAYRRYLRKSAAAKG